MPEPARIRRLARGANAELQGLAERLYARHGWQRCGQVPGYALLPHGGLCDTVFFYRTLAT